MDYTEYYNLAKPEVATDLADIDVLNSNMDTIDQALYDLAHPASGYFDDIYVSQTGYLNEATFRGDVSFSSDVSFSDDVSFSENVVISGYINHDMMFRTGYYPIVNNMNVVGVEANPIDSATDTLTTISIDGTIYDLGGGGTDTYSDLYVEYLHNYPGSSSIEIQTDVEITSGYSISVDGYNLVPVEANPAESPTDTLTSVNIGGTVYDISGGSSVTPNPQGEPTDTLSTIEIDGTVFDIGGSDGNSAYRETLLYEDISGAVDTSNITLDDSLGNYDALYFEYFFPNESTYVESTASPLIPIVETPTGSTKGKYYISTYPTYGSRYILLTSDGSTSATLTTGTWGESIKPSVYRIHGIKFGDGAGSEIIPISAGDGTTSRTFTLERTPKKVTLQGYTSGDGGWYESGYFIWGENFMNLIGAQYTIATGGYAGQVAISYGADGKSFTITAANAFGAFNRADSFSGMMLVDYGGSSSGGASKDILYNNPNGAPHLTDLALTHNIFDYDIVILTITNPTDISEFNAYTQHTISPMLYENGQRIGFQGLYDQRVVEITLASDGMSFKVVRVAGDYQNNTVYKILGIKY